MVKQGASFRKCWTSKFEIRGCSLNSVDGVTGSSVIAEHFVSHFSKSCSSNDANAASRLRSKYFDMRANYIGGHIDDSYKFNAELVENMIYQMKKRQSSGSRRYYHRTSLLQ